MPLKTSRHSNTVDADTQYRIFYRSFGCHSSSWRVTSRRSSCQTGDVRPMSINHSYGVEHLLGFPKSLAKNILSKPRVHAPSMRNHLVTSFQPYYLLPTNKTEKRWSSQSTWSYHSRQAEKRLLLRLRVLILSLGQTLQLRYNTNLSWQQHIDVGSQGSSAKQRW